MNTNNFNEGEEDIIVKPRRTRSVTTQIKVLKIGPNSPPGTLTKGTKGSSGYDIMNAGGDTVVLPDRIAPINTGIGLEMPNNVEGQIRGRSSLALKGISVFNGTIDSDYRGEIYILLENKSKVPYTVLAGEKIAQIIFTKALVAKFTYVEELCPSERGDGGFGSTGR